MAVQSWSCSVPTQRQRCINPFDGVLKWFPSTTILHACPWWSLPDVIHLPVQNSHRLCHSWSAKSPFFHSCLVACALLDAWKVKIVWETRSTRHFGCFWNFEMLWNLFFHLSVTSVVSLSVEKNVRVLKIVIFIENTLIGKEWWLRLEPEFRNKAGLWVLISVLTVLVVIVVMHVSSSRGRSLGPKFCIGIDWS